MQEHVWDDLKYLLALHRTGTLPEAARRAGVNETTVARRLKRLEGTVGTRLFLKNNAGRYELSEQGRAVLHHAENAEQEITALRDRLGQISKAMSKTVRITSVPAIINRILIPELHRLQSTNPDLTLELIPDARNVDLSRREADLALRFARPQKGGHAIKAQKIATLAFDVFASSDVPDEDIPSLPWIGIAEAFSTLPQAKWIETLRKNSETSASNLSVGDIDTAIEAAASKLGLAVIPSAIGARDTRLRAVSLNLAVPKMERDVWLLTHIDQTDLPSIKAVKDWLSEAFRP